MVLQYSIKTFANVRFVQLNTAHNNKSTFLSNLTLFWVDHELKSKYKLWKTKTFANVPFPLVHMKIEQKIEMFSLHKHTSIFNKLTRKSGWDSNISGSCYRHVWYTDGWLRFLIYTWMRWGWWHRKVLANHNRIALLLLRIGINQKRRWNPQRGCGCHVILFCIYVSVKQKPRRFSWFVLV